MLLPTYYLTATDGSHGLIAPQDADKSLIVSNSGKGISSYGNAWRIHYLEKDVGLSYHPTHNYLYVATGISNTLKHLSYSQHSNDQFIVFESRPTTNLLGFSGPRFSVNGRYIDLANTPLGATLGGIYSSTAFEPFNSSGIEYTTQGIPGKTKLEWGAQHNGITYYTWDTSSNSARVAPEQFVQWGFASDIRTSDDVGKSNLYACRYTIVNQDYIGPWTRDLTIPCQWTYGSNRTTSGSGTLQIQLEEKVAYSNQTSVNVTFTWDFTGASGPGGWTINNRIWYDGNAFTITTASGSWSTTMNCGVKTVLFQFWQDYLEGDDQWAELFYTGAQGITVLDANYDSAIKLYDEYIPGGAVFSEGVVQNGKLRSWTVDRAGNIVVFEIGLGQELSIDYQTYSAVPESYFGHEYYRRKRTTFDGKAPADYYSQNIKSKWSTSYNFDSVSYTLDTERTYKFRTQQSAMLFYWSKSGETNVYDWGYVDTKLDPWPMYEGTNTDATLTSTFYFPDPPGTGWVPVMKLRVGYTTHSAPETEVIVNTWTATNWSAINPYNFYTSVSANDLQTIFCEYADVQSGSGLGFSETVGRRTWKMIEYEDGEEGQVVSTTAYNIKQVDDWIHSSDQILAGCDVIKARYPYGHWKHNNAFLGVFRVGTAIVPWTYLTEPPTIEDLRPPLKMVQRDDGRGPHGGPGRIGYRGQNSGESPRIDIGGAW